LWIHGRNIWHGTWQCRKDWFEIVKAIKQTDKTMNHVQWEDVKLWIWQQMDCKIWSKLALLSVSDDYLACHDSYNDTRLLIIYVCSNDADDADNADQWGSM
jgi:hypothetical protein